MRGGSWIPALLAFATALPMGAQDYVPDRLIVKFKPEIADDADATLREGRKFSAQAPTTKLDSLMKVHGVRGARRLFAPTARTYSEARAFLESQAGRVRQKYPRRRALPLLPDLANVFVLDLAPGQNVLRAAAEFSKDPLVIYAEPVSVGHLAFVPNDPLVTCPQSVLNGTGDPRVCQWGLHRIRAPEAWDSTQGAGVVVAVLDSGLNRTHLDINDNVWTNPDEIEDGLDNDGNGFVDDTWGWDFVRCHAYSSPQCSPGEQSCKTAEDCGPGADCVLKCTEFRPNGDNDPSDEGDFIDGIQIGGHGTHVAGIVAAEANNGLDVAGVAFEATVMPLRVCDTLGACDLDGLAPAIVYAANNGAQVLNMSVAALGSGGLQVVHDAVQYADALGLVMVVAAGNYALIGNPPNFLAAFGEVISVASTDFTDARSDFSTYNDKVELAAPGGAVLSLRGLDQNGPVNSGTRVAYGTSMAAPHVAGLAALLWARYPLLTAGAVRASLCAGAVDLGSPGRDPYFGCGRIDAVRTLQAGCTRAVCGDGVQQPECGEECDDGNTQDGDGCSSTCRLCSLGVCGDGVYEPGCGEECDDGNTENGDGCSSSCLACKGAVCGDGIYEPACEECDDGDMQGGDGCSPFCTVGCGPCEIPAPDGGCQPNPNVPCEVVRSSTLGLSNGTPDTGDALAWKWVGYGSYAFGDPASLDDYAICVYDAVPNLQFTAMAPAAGSCGEEPCWQGGGARFKYDDPEGTPHGLSTLRLKTSRGKRGIVKVRIVLRGKGPNLSQREFGLPTLPLTLPIRVQLRATNGACWGATYSAAGVTENDEQDFKAKADRFQ